MFRDSRIYLEDILFSCRKILRFTSRMSQSEFVGEEQTYDAVLRNLEIIGEAVKRLPNDIKNKAPVIEWEKNAGLRDIISHAYFQIDNDILWDIVENKIPALMKSIEELLTSFDPGTD